MKIKTNELTGAALDWAVEAANGFVLERKGAIWYHNGLVWGPFRRYSIDWLRGGPIIEREDICLDQREGEPCRAFTGTPVHHAFAMFAPHGQPLVAAMRCFVASKLGDEVEIPEELTK